MSCHKMTTRQKARIPQLPAELWAQIMWMRALVMAEDGVDEYRQLHTRGIEFNQRAVRLRDSWNEEKYDVPYESDEDELQQFSLEDEGEYNPTDYDIDEEPATRSAAYPYRRYQRCMCPLKRYQRCIGEARRCEVEARWLIERICERYDSANEAWATYPQ